MANEMKRYIIHDTMEATSKTYKQIRHISLVGLLKVMLQDN